jgi:hypothetical protein
MPACTVCMEEGHNIQTCGSELIEECHAEGIRMSVLALCSSSNMYYPSLRRWISGLSKGMRRVLLMRKVPDVLRDDDSLYYISGDVIRSTSNPVLGDGVFNLYQHLGREKVSQDPSLEDRFRLMHMRRVNTMQLDTYRFNIHNNLLSYAGMQHYTLRLIEQLRETALRENITEEDEDVLEFLPEYIDEGVREQGALVERERNQQCKYSINCGMKEDLEVDSEAICGICWEGLTRDNVVRTNCNHLFCGDCLCASLQTGRAKNECARISLLHSCAMCRGEVVRVEIGDTSKYGDAIDGLITGRLKRLGENHYE